LQLQPIGCEPGAATVTERRTTITVGWRPSGAPARRFDDFNEAAPASPAILASPKPNGRRERRNIESRLENWAKWIEDDSQRPGMCSLGRHLDRMEKAEKGSAVGSGERRKVDEVDGLLVARAMIRITFDQRRLLGLKFVDDKREPFIAALLRFHPRDFDSKFFEACTAIEAALEQVSLNSNSK
jgi:hypothetical protein